ncbi:MAG TPA: hypothetical protein PK974_04800 [Rhodocyclaceae bacterium]|nr:hypothetical protein [Rhodocyclaceae bacterium]
MRYADYSDHERVALAWIEVCLPDNEVSDWLYAEVCRHFTGKELVDLSSAMIAINGWSRLAKPFRSLVGYYRPGDRAE